MTETPPPVDYIAQANMMHEHGPYVTPPATLYFIYTRPDGLESFLGPAAQAETHLREGCTITGEQTIEDFAAFNAEQTAKATPKATSKSTDAEADADEDAPKAHTAHKAKE